MKRKSKILAFIVMAAVAIGGTIWGIAHAGTHPCTKYILKSHQYQDKGVTYLTDAEGRPARATSADVKESRAARGRCQAHVGKLFQKKGRSGYDGGHLIAATLNGVDERYDLVPQNPNKNRSTMAQVENGIKACLHKGKQVVEYTVDVEYPNSQTIIPSRFHIAFMVKPSKKTFQGSFKNDSAEPPGFRESLNDTLSKAGCK